MLNIPYYAVIFTSIRGEDDHNAYAEMAAAMDALAKQQEGYLGMESARNEIGITVSYWSTLEQIRMWKANTDHLLAQQLGKEKWYRYYKVRICKVEREYEFENVD